MAITASESTGTVTLTIDGRQVTVPAGTSVMQDEQNQGLAQVGRQLVADDVAQLRTSYERFRQEAGDCHAVIAVGGVLVERRHRAGPGQQRQRRGDGGQGQREGCGHGCGAGRCRAA